MDYKFKAVERLPQTSRTKSEERQGKWKDLVNAFVASGSKYGQVLGIDKRNKKMRESARNSITSYAKKYKKPVKVTSIRRTLYLVRLTSKGRPKKRK